MRAVKPDEALVSAAQAGDANAIEELMQRYKNAVRARARKYFLAGAETEDLVQEGMIGLYFAILSYKNEAQKSFKNYAYLCVTRRMIDALRTAERKYCESDDLFDPEAFSEGETPEELFLIGEEESELNGMLMRELSDFEYRVLRLYLDGRSYRDISGETGKDVKSIDNALTRAKRKLLKSYQKKN